MWLLLVSKGIWKFELWRWLLFVAFTVPLYGISRLTLHVVILGLESHIVSRGALYYIVGIRVSNLCRSHRLKVLRCLSAELSFAVVQQR